MAAALQAQAGEDKLYRTAQVKVLTDGEATLPALRQALAWFTRDVQPGDTLFLLLSGHGVKTREELFFFAPVELDPENARGTGLPWREVVEKLQAAREQARSIWVLADTCRAAPGLARERQATGADLRREVKEGGNLVICTAAAGDRPSYESEALAHGLFTQAWLEALYGTAGPAYDVAYEETTGGRVLTLAGLQLIVSARVRHHARDSAVRQEVEFPRLEGRFSLSEPIFHVVPAPARVRE
jgi:uncharacterized caspase-like protein